MGLVANVYRSGVLLKGGLQVPDNALMGVCDCTLKGWSSYSDKVCILNAEGPFKPRDGVPGVVLVRHRTMKHVYAVSVDDHEKGLWTMMGGNFLHTSDSRFGETVRKLLDDPTAFVGAVPIHDRKE